MNISRLPKLLAAYFLAPVILLSFAAPASANEIENPESTEVVEQPEVVDPAPTQEAPTEVGSADELEISPQNIQTASDPTPTVTVSAQTVSATGSTTITVSGSGFDPSAATGTRPPLSGKSGGVYVVFGKFSEVWKPSVGAPSSSRYGVSAADGGQKWAVPADSIATVGGDSAGAIELTPEGTFTATIEVSKAAADAATTQTDFRGNVVTNLTASNYGIYTYPGSGASQPLFETYAPITFAGEGDTDETPTPNPQPDPGDEGSTEPLRKGSLSWGIDDSFRTYVTNFARGTITTSGGASYSKGNFRFGQSSTNAMIPDSVGTTIYKGSVRFRAHGGALDLSFSDPAVRVTSESSAVLTLRVNGKRVNLANLNLKTGSKSASAAGISYRNVRATLTSEGARSFLGFYAVGRTLDEVDFLIGGASGGQRGSTMVSGSSQTWRPPANAPATKGVAGIPEDELSVGDEVSIRADGFLANETNIKIVVYSTPIVLAEDVKADASGQVSWNGELPEGLEPGKHTITIQGSVARGAVFTIAKPKVVAGQCSVESANMVWGFKESFRSYVSGSFAKGSWELIDPTTYETPNFEFPEAQGVFNPVETSGEIEFTGGIRFRAHNDELDSIFTKPKIVFLNDDRALLYLDISQNNRELAEAGEIKRDEFKDVEFLELRLDEATKQSDGPTTTFTVIPAVFTAQGEQTFGTYEEGDLFDPITLVIKTDPDCGNQLADSEGPSTADIGPELLAYSAGVLALLAIIALAWWATRRKVVDR